MYKRVLTLIFLLLITKSLSAMDSNETTMIINEASKATEVLQNEFDILIDEVEAPRKEEVIDYNSSTPQLLSTIPTPEINTTLEVNNSLIQISKIVFEINETIETNQSMEANNTFLLVTEEVFEINQSLEINSSIIELNTSKKLSCKEDNHSIVINGLSIDLNNSISDNGCTDANLGTSIRGLIIFKTRIRPFCDISGETFAKQYMQEDWDDIYHEKELKMEVIKACPNIEKRYNDKWTPHLYQFSLEYASDSDAIPEC